MIQEIISGLASFILFNRLEITNFEGVFFVFFLFISVSLYYIFFRSKYILLALCIFFYICFSLKMTLFICVLGLLNYLTGILLSKNKNKILIIFAVGLNVLALGYYKYANFFIDSINTFARSEVFSTLTYLVIPLGISFFTFELIHYVVDIYRGKKPLYNIIDFFTFIFFFPTLIAGPIKRFEQFVPQLYEKRVNHTLIQEGMLLLIRGLFKKILIANALAQFATYGFNATSNATVTLIGIYAFSFQIYFDFSGYTDIARGSAALFGIKIPENFNQPYMAKSMPDFWRRWHISLMEWFKDYVYIPLGGSKKGIVRTIINTFIVFLLSGIWHGAGWHFIVWGGYHGLLVSVSQLVKQSLWMKEKKIIIHPLIAKIVTFHLVTIGWIFFRASSMENVGSIFQRILNPIYYSALHSAVVYKFFYIILLMVIYAASIVVLKKISTIKQYELIRYLAYGFGLVLIILSIATTGAPFIYFQF